MIRMLAALVLVILAGCTPGIAEDWTGLVAAEAAFVTMADPKTPAPAAAATPNTIPATEPPLPSAADASSSGCPGGQCPLPLEPPTEPAPAACPGGVSPLPPPAIRYHHGRFGRFRR